MDLVQIRYFLALAQTLNFTRAAEQCNVTQPALTKSIQRLEAELGGPLLLRERTLTQLTDLGRTMLPLLAEAFAAAERAKELAGLLRRKPPAPLRLGFGLDVPVEPFLALLAEIRRRLPATEVELVEQHEAALVDVLVGGSLDVALLSSDAALPARLNRWTLFMDQLVAVLPQDDPFADAAALPVAVLADRPLIAGPALPAGFPAPRHRTASAVQALHLVRAGFGVAVSSERAASRIDLPWRRFDPSFERAILLAVVPGRPHSRAADGFVKLARAQRWAAIGDQDGV